MMSRFLMKDARKDAEHRVSVHKLLLAPPDLRPTLILKHQMSLTEVIT